MKKRFARYSAITAYVADGEDLAVHTSLERPAGPRARVGRRRAAGRRRARPAPTVVSDVSALRGLGGGGARHGQRDGGARPHRGRPLGHPRGLERLPRRVHAPGREAARTRWRRRWPRRPPPPEPRPVARARRGHPSRRWSRRSARTARSTSPPSRRTSRRTPPHDLGGYLVLGSNGEAAEPGRGREARARARGARRAPGARSLLVGHRPRVHARHHRPHRARPPTSAPTPRSSSPRTTTSRR